MTDNRFKELIAADKDMMTILTIIVTLPLADAWLAAGAIRRIDDQLELFAPYGLADILAFECHPTPHFLSDKERLSLYQKRLVAKNWKEKWPQLRYFLD
ncbi:nucleotidyltransferase family protein [Streptococcus dysgalactiae]|uniref:nucleotidyltransferase family protein n=1 Tax=Streptococcus dysgalactiae TaxID=1334 RepID=UPI003D70ECDF